MKCSPCSIIFEKVYIHPLTFSLDLLLNMDLIMTASMSLSPIVFAGPSGVGKGTLVKKLMDKWPSKFGFSVSHTTRAPRPGEENGVHYNFVEKAVMEEEISKGMFIEYANVHVNIYGTSIAAVEKVKAEGKVCILDIDIQGVKSVKASNLDAKYLFVMPPSIEGLESRLRGRGTETEDKIQVRMKNALTEIEYGKGDGNFDAVVTNDDLDMCFEEIVQTIHGWFPSMELVE